MRVFRSALALLSYFSALLKSPCGVFNSISVPSLIFAAAKAVEQREDCFSNNGASDDNVCESGKSVNADVDVNANVNADDDNSSTPWWKDGELKLMDMWKFLKCEEVFDDDRPVHNESTWMLMRGAYIGAVGPDDATIVVVGQNRLFGNGFKPGTVEVRVAEDKGRGVYAIKTFEKGELVWSTQFTACFTDGMDYRKFLASIPSDLACDVFEWAYSGKDYGVCVDLDEGSLINHASSAGIDKKYWEIGNNKPNIGMNAETGYQHAIENINPGDELLTDYYSFAEEDAWEYLGLGKW